MNDRASAAPVRALWLTLAGVSLGAGALGIVVPLLPTTPFVLVAAYAAAKGSPRLHAWILRHRAFGPIVRDWQAGGAVTRKTKLVALATMSVSAAIAVLVTPPAAAVAAIGSMTLVGAWLWRRPEPAR